MNATPMPRTPLRLAALLLFTLAVGADAWAQKKPPAPPKAPPKLPTNSVPKGAPTGGVPANPPPVDLPPGEVGTRPGPVSPPGFGQVDDRPILVIDPQGYVDDVMGLSFSPDGRLLAAAGGKEVRIWDMATKRPHRTLRGERSRGSLGNCFAVAFSPDGRELVVGVDDYSAVGSIRVYDTQNLDEIKQVVGGHNVPVRKLAFSRDGRYLASAGENGTILLWDWPARKPLGKIAPSQIDQPLYSYFDFPTAASILLIGSASGPELYSVPEGRRLGPQDNIPAPIRQWFAAVPAAQYPEKSNPDILFNPLDLGVWFGAGEAKTPRGMKYWTSAWRGNTAAPARIYNGHRWTVRSITVDRSGTVAASADRFGEIHVWDVASGKGRMVLRGAGRPIYSVGFQPGSAGGADLSQMRILYGTDAYGASEWNFNHYARNNRMLDLGKRALSDIPPLDPLPTAAGPNGVKLTLETLNDIYQLTARNGNQPLGTHKLSTGHTPMAFGFLRSPRFGTNLPAMLSTDSGALYCVDPVADQYRRWFMGHGAAITSFQEAPDSQLLLSGSTDRTMRLWSLNDYRPAGDFGFRYLSNVITELKPNAPAAGQGFRVGDKLLSLDGKSLTDWDDLRLLGKLNYAAGQTIPVRLERAGKPLVLNLTLVDGYDSIEPTLNVFTTDDGEWIVWTPQGYYDASPGGDRLVGWHLNQGRTRAAKFFLAEQFRKLMYRPDIIDRVLRTGRLDESIAQANKDLPRPVEPIDLRQRQTLLKLEPPTVRLLSPVDGLKLGVMKTIVKAVIESASGQPLKDVRLLVNGRPAGGPIELPGRNATRFELNQELALSPGRNDVAIVASNAASDSQAKGITLFAPAAKTPKPNLYVLSIGISKYSSDQLQLQFADKDAREFDRTIRSHTEGDVYGTVTAKMLLNEQATRQNILNELDWLQKSAKSREDVAMLFLSAHGFRDDKLNFYLGSHDANPEGLLATTVSVTQIQDVLKGLTCRVVLFVDTCHAGGIGSIGSFDPYRDFSDEQVGAVVFCSSTQREESLEDPKWGHGAFTRAILDMVADHTSDLDKPPDGQLNLSEVQFHLSKRVIDLTRGAQHPVVGRPTTVTEFNVFQTGQRNTTASVGR